MKQVVLAVCATPRAGRDEVVGVRCGAAGSDEVCVRVTAPPDGGRANKAVCKVVAAKLNIPKSRVEVVGGTTSRHKRLAIDAEEASVSFWVATLPRL